MKYIKGFKGTFSSNNAPYLHRNESIIINFSKYDEEGTHFVCIIGFKNNQCLYFDPLCINAQYIPKEIKKYLKKYVNTVNISKKIQHDDSLFCGLFCMLMIITFNISKSYLYKVLRSMKYSDFKNDQKCVKMLSEAIGKYFQCE